LIYILLNLTSEKICPGCGQFEDAQHVWKCPAQSANETGKEAFDSLRTWCTSVQTDLEVAESVLLYFDSWRNDYNPNISFSIHIKYLILQQSQIGWRQFLEGFVYYRWEDAQAKYYQSIRSLRTGRHWLMHHILKLWGIA
jgi:hypothetical protein